MHVQVLCKIKMNKKSSFFPGEQNSAEQGGSKCHDSMYSHAATFVKQEALTKNILVAHDLTILGAFKVDLKITIEQFSQESHWIPL
jgi:hypothetical protein